MRVLLNDICKNLQNTACATLFDYVYYLNKYGRSTPHVSIIPSVEVNLDEIHWTNEQQPSLELKNYCYFILLNQDDNINLSTAKEVIKNVTKILGRRPKLVLTITTNNDKMANFEFDESVLFPWIVLTNNYKVTITCPGCGITHHGLWNKKVADKAGGIGSFSKNLQQPVCCDMLKEKKLRISYNNAGKFWNMTNSGNVDTGTYEGYLMHTFTKKYQLQTEFLNANWKWGSFDEKTKLWNGGVGNVCKL